MRLKTSRLNKISSAVSTQSRGSNAAASTFQPFGTDATLGGMDQLIAAAAAVELQQAQAPDKEMQDQVPAHQYTLDVQIQWMPDHNGELQPFLVLANADSEDEEELAAIARGLGPTAPATGWYMYEFAPALEYVNNEAATAAAAGHGAAAAAAAEEAAAVAAAQMAAAVAAAQMAAAGAGCGSALQAAPAAGCGGAGAGAGGGGVLVMRPTRKLMPEGAKVCSNCGTTSTSAWRRTKDTRDLVCNSCGDYYRRNGRHRRVAKRSVSLLPPPLPPPPPNALATGLLRVAGRPEVKQCSNCSSTNTPTWRRDVYGCLLCNACGLYYRSMGRHRPLPATPAQRLLLKRNAELLAQVLHGERGEVTDADAAPLARLEELAAQVVAAEPVLDEDGLVVESPGAPAPPPWQRLRASVYMERQRSSQLPSQARVCSCSRAAGQSCTDADGCLTRRLRIACAPGVCPAGEACVNGPLAERPRPARRLVPVGSKGWGVAAAEDIPAGSFVDEYTGEVVTVVSAMNRLAAYVACGGSHSYVMAVTASEAVDATSSGSAARFINHSCEPNCEVQKWQVDGETAIAIFATQDIPAGAELSIDYSGLIKGTGNQRCWCGTASCQGVLPA